jgi:hypothetical protein
LRQEVEGYRSDAKIRLPHAPLIRFFFDTPFNGCDGILIGFSNVHEMERRQKTGSFNQTKCARIKSELSCRDTD